MTTLTSTFPIAFGTDESGGYFSEYAFSPRVGITYEFFPGAAAYFNWSRSFNPQWFSTDAGKENQSHRRQGRTLKLGSNGRSSTTGWSA